MKFTVLTLFPDMIRTTVHTSITGRAIDRGVLSVDTVNIRDFSIHGTKRVDDYPYGGGAGMVMEAEPVWQAVKSVEDRIGHKPRVIYLTPQARVLTQTQVEAFAREEELVLLCGHYEGIDERVLEETVTDYVSIGDYVLTGGELAAAVLIDAVSRFVPGVLHNEESSQFESLQDNLLEYPHYTRPEVWHGRAVPEVLLSGDHGKVEAWRYEQSLKRTAERRPDLLEKSYRIQGIWFGGDSCGVLAEKLTAAVSRYGTATDYRRRKLQKQTRILHSQDLLICFLPQDAENELPLKERFRNLRGIDAKAVLVCTDHVDIPEMTRAFFRERGFHIIGEFSLRPDTGEESIAETALHIREKALQI